MEGKSVSINIIPNTNTGMYRPDLDFDWRKGYTLIQSHDVNEKSSRGTKWNLSALLGETLKSEPTSWKDEATSRMKEMW